MSKFIHILIMIIGIVSCDRNTIPCEGYMTEGVLIPVQIDWSESGLWLDSGVLDVHRVSLRFFGSDGSVFERYLESDLMQGEIYVPVGEYKVLALNESVLDGYYSGFVVFTDLNDYDGISAELLVDDASGVAEEPKQLAAWALDNFVVTTGMVAGSPLSEYELGQMQALTDIVMEPRTRRLRVELVSENLGSVQSVVGAVSGLPMRVNLVTGESESTPTIHQVSLSDFAYDSVTRADADADGTASGEQTCFEHSQDYTDKYTVSFQVYLNDGTEHTDDEQLTDVDVSSQVTDSDDDEGYTVTHSYSFPIVEQSDVTVNGWEDGGNIVLGGE